MKSLDKLKTVSTATAATALFKRGFRTQCIQNVHPLSPGQPVLVGPAFTLRYIPAREDLNKLDVFRDRSHPQRKAVEDCPPGAVMVMDSRKDARAASAGAILVTRLMKRGVAGVVTDGGFRDSAEIAALGIPAYHQRPSAPTNLTLHQAIDINVPIGCGDAPVFPGDIILGDQDGVIVIPASLLDEIADEAFEMTAYEDFVTEQVRAGKGIFGLYPATDPQSLTDFAAWRKANGRWSSFRTAGFQPAVRRRTSELRRLHHRHLAQQRDVGGDDAPALGRTHPGVALPAGAVAAMAAELAVGGAEVAAVGDDPDLQQVAVEHETGIAAGAEGGDLVVAVELLADAVAQGVRALPEQLVEHGDVVAVQRLLVALEGGGHLGHDFGDVDFHCAMSSQRVVLSAAKDLIAACNRHEILRCAQDDRKVMRAAPKRTPCFSRWRATRSAAASL